MMGYVFHTEFYKIEDPMKKIRTYWAGSIYSDAFIDHRGQDSTHLANKFDGLRLVKADD